MFGPWRVDFVGGPGLANSNSRWRRPPFLNQLNGHNSAIFERICTKFHTGTKNKDPGQLLPSELVSNKIQDGGGRHIEITFLAITRPFFCTHLH